MTLLTAISALALVASLTALAAWRAHGRLRDRHAHIDALRARETYVLDATRDFMEASRISSDAVIARLAESVRRRDPALDTFLLFAPEGEELACTYADGARAHYYRSMRLRRDGGEALPSLAACAGHRIAGVDRPLVPNDRSALAVPMADRGGLHAVVYVSSCTASRSCDEETIVRTIEHAASPFALAIERESARAEATYDGLTGLMTPRALRERLREEIARTPLRKSALLSLWFVDTDRFKAVNDEHGHAAGDRVLQSMARLLRAHCVTDVDVPARNGGDEFCALIFDAQKSVAIERAQALCEAVRRYDFGIGMQITASIGVASYPYDANDASGLLEAADAAMYYSKREGRDRVAFAHDGGRFSVYRA